MEDDFRDYEEYKEKIITEDYKSKTSLKMNPSAFMTPGSQKLEREGLDMLQDEDAQKSGIFMTPQRNRSDEHSNGNERLQRSNEYISNLLNNILPEHKRDL